MTSRPTCEHGSSTLAEGNPLFAEQLLSHAIEQGGRVEAPPTIEALLAARIDGLGTAERSVLDAAAVIGDEFTLAAAQALMPTELTGAAPEAVTALVRRDLVRSGNPASADTLRFSHSLVRETAYAGLLKRTRAQLHERYAAWLERRPVGQEALIGYHLGHAHRALVDVGGDEARREELAIRAAGWLGAGASSALRRGDFVNAEALATRGLALLGPADGQRPSLKITFGRALASQRRSHDAYGAFRQAEESARRLGDADTQRQAELYLMQQRLYAETELEVPDLEEMETAARAAVDAFEAAGDHHGAYVAWVAVHNFLYARGRYGDAIEAVDQAIVQGREAGELEARLLARPMLLHVYGPTPSFAGIALANELLAEDVGLAGRADALAYGGVLHAMRGDPETGRGWVRQSQELWRQAGADGGGWFGEESMVNVLAEAWPAAESSLRAQCELLDRPGLETTFATYASVLAGVLLELGRDAEADTWAADSERRGAACDFPNEAGWRAARARVLARRGAFDEAEALAREAVALVGLADDLWARGDAGIALSEVLVLAGRDRRRGGSRDRCPAELRGEGTPRRCCESPQDSRRHRTPLVEPLRNGLRTLGARLCADRSYERRAVQRVNGDGRPRDHGCWLHPGAKQRVLSEAIAGPADLDASRRAHELDVPGRNHIEVSALVAFAEDHGSRPESQPDRPRGEPLEGRLREGGEQVERT